MATQDQGSSHWQRPSVGAGIAVVSTFGPTLGLPIPLTLRWIGFSIGVLLIFWPLIVRAHRRVRQMNIEPWHLQIIGLVGVIVFAAVAATGVIWERYGRASHGTVAVETTNPAPVPVDAKGDIVWDPGFFLRARTTNSGVEFYGFQLTGWNNSGKFLDNLGGYVRSEKNGKTFPIRLQHRDKLIAPDGYGIPAGHQFHIGAEFMDRGGLYAPQFVTDYGVLTFEFEYGGASFKRTYSADEVLKEVERVEAFLKPQPVKTVAGFTKIDDKKRYTQFDLQKRQQALDEFSGLVNGPMRELYETGQQIWNAWNTNHNAIGPKEFGERLDHFRAMIVNQEKIAMQVMEKYERYPDVIQEINWTDAPLMATTDALRLEIMRIRRLLGNDDRAELLLNNRFTEEWRESVNTFSNVIGRMKQTIRTLQTRYENSEIIDATK